MHPLKHKLSIAKLLTALAAASLALPELARADAVTDWNVKTHEFIAEAKLGTPPAVRVVALVQTAVAEAVAGIASPTASPTAQAMDSAVAAATRATLVKLLPAQQTAIDAAYQTALATLPDGAARATGQAAGERAAAAVLARRADDGVTTPDSYRPHTTPGAYVPTVTPAVTQWPQRKPWLLAHPASLRPAAPPALNSATWAREFNEVKALGGRVSSARSAEQTEVARFWDYSLPAIYFGVLRSVAQQSGRDVARNARLYAAAAQAMDDAMIAVFDAKYHHNFWRPTTAIRNADADGNEATERDARWAPLIDVPMHPEYPSGHSILASAVAGVIKADVGAERLPLLATTSPTASPTLRGVARRWSDLDSFVREVSQARIWGGLHFRSATETGEAMGRGIAKLAAEQWLTQPQ